MNTKNQQNMFDKLFDLNINEYLNNEEQSKMNDIFNQAIMDDWIYDTNDNSLRLKIKLINKSQNPDPTYQKLGDSGFDFMADLPEGESIIIPHMERALIPTGLYFQIPMGFELQVRPRSGLALKNGITVLNTPGTVDSGYRGEVKVILFNTDEQPFVIKNGDRIAQGVIAPVQFSKTTKFVKVNNLDESDRNSGGFGSTGV
jgi:dUTP pyrophosphatase